MGKATPEVARKLRRSSTDAEQRLWRRLRARQLDGFKFRRQEPVGPYIADFLCYERKLVVELDGGQHAESGSKDAERTAFLSKHGFQVIRFWDHDVLFNTEGVLARLLEVLRDQPPQ